MISVRTISSGFKEKELTSLSAAKRGDVTRVYLPGDSAPGPYSEKRLLVLMVGWAESRHSAISKYASIYTTLGLPCVAMAPRIPLVWFTSLANKATRNMLGVLDSSLECPASLLFHIFSGGGAVVFPLLLDEYAKSGAFPSKLAPIGAVFDSGPAKFGVQAGFAASKLLYQQGAFNVLTYSLANAVGFVTDLAIGSRKRSEHAAALGHPQLLELPQLYLLSEKDSVHPAEAAREVMEGQRKKGREVRSQCWTDTEHVKHFTKHPEAYSKEITAFIAHATKEPIEK